LAENTRRGPRTAARGPYLKESRKKWWHKKETEDDKEAKRGKIRYKKRKKGMSPWERPGSELKGPL